MNQSIINIGSIPKQKNVLMLAIELGELEMVKYLIENNASLNYHDDKGNSPWGKVLEGRHQSLLEYFTTAHMAYLKADDVAGQIMKTQIHESQKLEVLKYLISHGLEVDLKTPQGNTLLACALQTGQNSIINFLVDSGANLYSVNNKGQSIIDLCNSYLRYSDTLNKIRRLIKGSML